ncbi:MAG: recombinase family protein [Clostridiales bacterium]|nr:recombinase family protein [Clostridiales bacterium]
MTYGYVRVSSRDQNEDRQMAAMAERGIPPENIFLDKQSGKDFNRENHKKLIDILLKDDLIVIKSIDRLGRNYGEIIEQWRYITKTIGADIVVLDMPLLDTTKSKDLLGTLISDIVLQLLSFAAENEREAIKVRQQEGIIEAMKKGVKFGRPGNRTDEEYDEILGLEMEGKINRDEAMALMRVSRSSYYRIRRKMFLKHKNKNRTALNKGSSLGKR